MEEINNSLICREYFNYINSKNENEFHKLFTWFFSCLLTVSNVFLFIIKEKR